MDIEDFDLNFLGRERGDACADRGSWRDGWANLYLGFNRFFCYKGGGRDASSSLELMVRIGEGFSWVTMKGMITEYFTVDRMINCELTALNSNVILDT